MAHVSSLTPPRGLARRWLLALRNVGIGALLLAATLLVLGFLTLTSAHAQAKPELRIGYQKSASLFVLQKAQGTLEKSLAPLGFGVKWVEFPAGPQLLEGLNVGAVDVGYVGEAPPIFAQAAGGRGALRRPRRQAERPRAAATPGGDAPGRDAPGRHACGGGAGRGAGFAGVLIAPGRPQMSNQPSEAVSTAAWVVLATLLPTAAYFS